jgi:sortilin
LCRYSTVYEDTTAMAAGVDKSWDYNVHFVYSTDLFETAHNRLLLCGNAFEVLNGDVYVAQLRDCEAFHGAAAGDKSAEGKFPGTDITLRISTDAGKTFKQACFPVALSQKGYTLFDFHGAKGGPDFISVDHDEEDAAEAAAPMGNLYSSDDSLQLFSLNMRRNVRFGGAAVDFANVEGIDGVYVANQISGGAFANPAFIAKTKAVDDFVHTRITYNGGGAWHALKPPLVDCNGAPITCHAGGKCDLHLHGASHWQRGTWKTRLGSVYSQAAAPGVILATGNVGEFLSSDANSVNTFLSRDAGVTWEEILKVGLYKLKSVYP